MFQEAPTWAELTAIIVYICTYVSVEGGSQFIYMTNYCSMSVLVDVSLLLELTPPDSLGDDRSGDFLHCDVDILAPRNTKLLAHFQQLGISSVTEHSDRLQLYEGSPSNARLTPIKGLYGRLDTPLSSFDSSGRKVKDYKTSSNTLKVDYLGKPTKKFPGFRLVITTFQDPTSAGECPPKHYHCRRASFCVMRQVVCDDSPNCGKDDDGDESECDTNDTVTNLLAQYSLTRDIIVVILLPVVSFLAAVVAIYLAARQYIRLRIEIADISAVHFTANKDGHVKIANKNGAYNPPTYQDIMDMCAGYEPPPTYNQLVSSVTRYDRSTEINHGIDIVITEESKLTEECDLCGHVTCDFSLSFNPEEVNCSRHDDYRLNSGSSSDADDDGELNNRRRKGGKGKVKKKVIDNEHVREDSQHSLVTSCCTDQCVYEDTNTSSQVSNKTSFCTCELDYLNSTQPHQDSYLH